MHSNAFENSMRTAPAKKPLHQSEILLQSEISNRFEFTSGLM